MLMFAIGPKSGRGEADAPCGPASCSIVAFAATHNNFGGPSVHVASRVGDLIRTTPFSCVGSFTLKHCVWSGACRFKSMPFARGTVASVASVPNSKAVKAVRTSSIHLQLLKCVQYPFRVKWTLDRARRAGFSRGARLPRHRTYPAGVWLTSSNPTDSRPNGIDRA